MPLPRAFVVWSAMTAALQGMSRLISHSTIRTFFSTSGSTLTGSWLSFTMSGVTETVATFGVGAEHVLAVVVSGLLSVFGPS